MRGAFSCLIIKFWTIWKMCSQLMVDNINGLVSLQRDQDTVLRGTPGGRMVSCRLRVPALPLRTPGAARLLVRAHSQDRSPEAAYWHCTSCALWILVCNCVRLCICVQLASSLITSSIVILLYFEHIVLYHYRWRTFEATRSPSQRLGARRTSHRRRAKGSTCTRTVWRPRWQTGSAPATRPAPRSCTRRRCATGTRPTGSCAARIAWARLPSRRRHGRRPATASFTSSCPTASLTLTPSACASRMCAPVRRCQLA